MSAEEELNERKRLFMDFLEADHGQNGGRQRLDAMMQRDEMRFVLDMNLFREFRPAEAESFLKAPHDYLAPYQDAVKETVLSLDPNYGKTDSGSQDFFLGVEGSFGRRHVSPRGLVSYLLGGLVQVEGIVTRCSVVRPKVVTSVHYCPETGREEKKEYRDVTSLGGLPTGASYPQRDQSGNPLVTEYGLSTYKDHQTVTVQEMPEKAPAGVLPRSVEIIVENDLVDKVKPGDRVQVVGLFKALGSKASGHTNGLFKTVLIANNVRSLVRDVMQPTLTEQDMQNIRALSRTEDVFDTFSRSLAPHIYGHETIKHALLLQLLGGCEKNLANKTHIRGDINMLLLGDPSTAKSQFLRFVLNIAPLAVATTGRGSSGVGLTAAITSDPDTGERRLEAGAMVLADRGIVCIDEFDKMSDVDRVAIHEVMEQGSVTIAKAGIHTTLNARCSVIAAANPIYGSYNPGISMAKNIALPDSLLSRFDLVFIVLDKQVADEDKAIADHVLKLHQYRGPNEDQLLSYGASDTLGEELEIEDEEEDGSTMWTRFDKLLHSRGHSNGSDDKIQVLSIPFIKKYLFYAKNRIKPTMTSEVCEQVSDKYAEWRDRTKEKAGMRKGNQPTPVTPRLLETVIRLASAHAKLRLSSVIHKEDVDAVTAIIEWCLFKQDPSLNKDEAPEEEEKGKDDGKDDVDDDDDDIVVTADEGAGAGASAGRPSGEEATSALNTSGTKRPHSGEEGADDADEDADAPERASKAQKNMEDTAGAQLSDAAEEMHVPVKVSLPDVSAEQLDSFKQSFSAAMRRSQKTDMQQIAEFDGIKGVVDEKMIMACLKVMETNGEVLEMDGDIYSTIA